MRRLVSCLALCVVGAGRALAGPTVAKPSVSPTSVPVNGHIPVTVTAAITDSSLIASSVTLVLANSVGTPIQVIGQMRDDGTNGDVTAGDHLFSVRTTIPDSLSGIVNVRVSAAFRGLLQRVLSVPAVIHVTSPKLITEGTTGITIAIPDLGAAAQVQFESNAGPTPFIDVKLSSGGSGQYVSAFKIFISSNISGSLQDWFAANVDSSGQLLATATFVSETLPNGAHALVQAAPVPETYDGEPIEIGYLLSPSGERLLSMSISESNPLYDFGYSSDDVVEIAKEILRTVQFP